MNQRKVALVIIFISFVVLALLVRDWKGVRVVGTMMGIFLLPLIWRTLTRMKR